MRIGVHPIDRADHHARPDQHRRRSDLGMLPRLSRLVRRKCCVRLSVCCYPDNPGRHQAFRVAALCGRDGYHTRRRRLRSGTNLLVWRTRLLPLRHRQRWVGAVPEPLRGEPRHDPTSTPYRLRGWGAPDYRKPMAEYRAAAAMAYLAAMSRHWRPLRVRTIPLLGCLYYAQPGRSWARPGAGARRRVHDPAARAGNGTQPRMAS